MRPCGYISEESQKTTMKVDATTDADMEYYERVGGFDNPLDNVANVTQLYGWMRYTQRFKVVMSDQAVVTNHSDMAIPGESDLSVTAQVVSFNNSGGQDSYDQSVTASLAMFASPTRQVVEVEVPWLERFPYVSTGNPSSSSDNRYWNQFGLGLQWFSGWIGSELYGALMTVRIMVWGALGEDTRMGSLKPPIFLAFVTAAESHRGPRSRAELERVKREYKERCRKIQLEAARLRVALHERKRERTIEQRAVKQPARVDRR